MHTLRFAGWSFLCCLLVAPAASPAGEAVFRAEGGELVVQMPGWTLALDVATGALRRLEDRQAAGTLLRGQADLWTIQRHKAADVLASQCTMKHAWDPAGGVLTLEFDGPDAAATIRCTAAAEGPAWQAQVRIKQGTMIGWRFPRVEFDVAGLEEFVLPEHLGLKFLRPFFEPNGGGVARHPLGPKGLQQVTGDRCQMGPLRDEPLPLRTTPGAAGWLPEWYLKELPRWRVSTNRCSAKPDLTLLESDNGSWLSGYQLGGWGWLFRVGGILRQDDSRAVQASVIATLAKLHRSAPSGGKDVEIPKDLVGQPPARWATPPQRIGIVMARPASRPGVRLNSNPKRWITDFAGQTWIRQAGIEVVTLSDAAAVRAALAQPRQWFALLNTLGEGLPAEGPQEVGSMLDAVRKYVREGGIWWETGGGYSFYTGIVPAQEMAFRTANRDFCDFAALKSAAGRWALYGVQAPAAIFVPPQGEIKAFGPAAARRGSYEHTFMAYAAPNHPAELPRQQMVLGQPHRAVLAQYAQRNQFTRGLADKTKPAVAEALKRSILLKVSTRKLAESTKIAETLPYPVLFHIADYLRGGFDKQYPDHLPPNPNVGTPEDLAALVAMCRGKGHLFMPYTNPTWWCVNPKGPTFETQGDAALSLGFEGQQYPESYGNHTAVQGYAICAWHPAVVAANDITRRQFTEQYPVDVLFQDQVGARGLRWDTNAAAPHPGAYLEGMHRIAQRDSAVVPLGTEDGHDRLINYETMFTGLSFPWLPNRPSNPSVQYDDLWPAEAWRHEPLALFLAHDKVLFYHHDLGGFVRSRLDLAVTLAMGFNLSWWTHTATPSETERDWLDRLCRLQAAIGPRCAGRRLDDFSYLAPRVLRSRWGDLEIIANLTPQPWPVAPGVIIAPEGFRAKSPDLEAGIFVNPDAKDAAADVHWTIRLQGADAWTAGPESQGRP